MYIYKITELYTHTHTQEGAQNFLESLKKWFKIVLQVWNCSPLKVLLLWLHAVIPPPLSLLVTFVLKPSMEMLSRAASNCRWTSAMSAKHLPFKSCFVPGNKKKGARSVVGWVGGGGVGHNHFVFSQKEGVLLMLQRFNEHCWQPLTAFPLKILDNVSAVEVSLGLLHPVTGAVL